MTGGRTSRERWAVTLVTGATAATTLVPGPGIAERADPGPNIILISVDDMRADDIRVMDNLRGLLTEQGTTFANSFSPF